MQKTRPSGRSYHLERSANVPVFFVLSACTVWTGHLFSSVLFQMRNFRDSQFRSAERPGTAPSRLWKPCAHLAHIPVGSREAPRGT